MRAKYGDASRIDTLEAAGVATADVLVISASDFHEGFEVFQQVREKNPQIRIIAGPSISPNRNRCSAQEPMLCSLPRAKWHSR